MVDDFLIGAIDLHVHAAPDVKPRFTGSVETARLATEAGMAGFALKNHHYSTVPVTDVLQNAFPITRLYSYLVLNKSVGGLNPDAVRISLDLGVTIVSLPTIESDHHYATSGQDPSLGIHVSDENGDLLPRCREVLEMVGAADRVLATGHVSPQDSLRVLRYARSVGVRRMLVTHVSAHRISMPIEMQQEAARLGAFMEHSAIATTATLTHSTSTSAIAEQIRRVGCERCILSTDFGQPENPPFTTGLRSFCQELTECGISQSDVVRMVKEQPSSLVT